VRLRFFAVLQLGDGIHGAPVIENGAVPFSSSVASLVKARSLVASVRLKYRQPAIVAFPIHQSRAELFQTPGFQSLPLRRAVRIRGVAGGSKTESF